MSKKIAIVQSNYIPWKGYFDLICKADEFVLYDEMQYTKRDWRNRNRIKTPHGLKWLTIPVKVSGKFEQKINETQIADKKWNEKHWKTLRHMYTKAPYFDEYSNKIEALYRKADFTNLSEVNYHFLVGINKILEIKTLLTWSSDYEITDGKTNRLVNICKQAGAATYLSGPSAKDYIDIELFKDEGIEVEWMDYDGYKEYPQLYGEFEHGVTILDLIFNTGEKARQFLKA